MAAGPVAARRVRPDVVQPDRDPPEPRGCDWEGVPCRGTKVVLEDTRGGAQRGVVADDIVECPQGYTAVRRVNPKPRHAPYVCINSDLVHPYFRPGDRVTTANPEGFADVTPDRDGTVIDGRCGEDNVKVQFDRTPKSECTPLTRLWPKKAQRD